MKQIEGVLKEKTAEIIGMDVGSASSASASSASAYTPPYQTPVANPNDCIRPTYQQFLNQMTAPNPAVMYDTFRNNERPLPTKVFTIYSKTHELLDVYIMEFFEHRNRVFKFITPYTYDEKEKLWYTTVCYEEVRYY